MNGFLALLVRPWTHYADFSGRSRRSEYWLFIIIRWAVLFFLLSWAPADRDASLATDEMSGGLLAALALWLLGTTIPAWAVAARRLHDANLSGKWLLACFVPYFGILASLVFGLLPGTPGENDKGFDPRLPEFDDQLEDTFS